MSDTPSERVWIANKPEDRLKIATFRFLKSALVPPFYVVSIQDADGGGRSDLQRIRDANKGIVSGQLDMEISQGPPPLIRKLELKRGRNKPTEHQLKTIADLTACGAPPIVAWSLREVHDGLFIAGFVFLPNWRTTLAHMEAQLEAWDRQASDIKSGATVRKPSKPRGPRVRPGLSWIRP